MTDSKICLIFVWAFFPPVFHSKHTQFLLTESVYHQRSFVLYLFGILGILSLSNNPPTNLLVHPIKLLHFSFRINVAYAKRQRGMFDSETEAKEFYLSLEPTTLPYPRLLLVTPMKLWFDVVWFGFSIFFNCSIIAI